MTAATDETHHGTVIRPTTAAHPAPSELERVDCAVVIVTYNSADHIVALLESIPAAAAGLRLRVVVVDNGSTDNTTSLVESAGVTCIQTGANLGYAGAINVGRQHARPCDALLVLNPDLTLEPRAIEHMHATLGADGVGVVVPRLHEANGSTYPSLRREPSVLRALGDALFGSRFRSRPSWASEIEWRVQRYSTAHDIDWATGAALMINHSCDRAVGLWDDERFFLYSEETDFAARARRAGYAIRYEPRARAHHRRGGSGGSDALVQLMAVNRVRYFTKYHSRPAVIVFRAIVILHSVLRAADSAHRATVRTLVRRSVWSRLPGGR